MQMVVIINKKETMKTTTRVTFTAKRTVLLLFVMLLANILYASGPAHVVVAPATCVINGSSAPYNTLHGGDTLLMTSGNKSYILISNFTGTSTAPIVVIN